MLPTRDPDDDRNGPIWLRRHLLADGYDDRAIQRMRKSGQLVRVRHGAYAEGSVWNRLDESGRYGLRVRSVVASAETPVVVSHVSALPEFEAPLWGLDLTDVHLTREDSRSGRAEAGVRQHCGVIEDGDIVDLNGLQVMHPTRLALEVMTVATTEAALIVLCHLLHAGMTTLEELEARYARMTRWPRSLRTEVVLRLASGRFESVGETRLFYLCHRHHIPMPVPQYEIKDASGRVVHRVDFAWPELGVFLEFDGRIKYEKLLREGERASDVVIREKQREELVCALTGWRCIRITWADLEHPARTAAMILAVLQARAA